MKRNMDLQMLKSEGDDAIEPLKKALSTVYLGEVMNIWQEQRQICARSHADFAKHLLDIHKSYCVQYCQTEAWEQSVKLSDMAKHQYADGTNEGQIFLHDTTVTSTKWEDEPSSEGTLLEEDLESPTDDIGNTKAVDIKPLACPHCGETFTQTSFFESHMEAHNIKASPDILGQINTMRQHKVYESDDLGVKPNCATMKLKPEMDSCIVEKEDVDLVRANGFKNFGNLDSNKATDVNIQTGSLIIQAEYVCFVCKKAFGVKNLLRKHMLTHSRGKRHISFKCGQRFSQLQNLKMHKLYHTKETLFQLKSESNISSDCGQGLYLEQSLERQLMTEPGKRCHPCSVCNKEYRTRSALKTHMKKHTVAKPHVCSECGKSFRHLSNLRTHIVAHTSQRRHVCSVCNKCFMNLSTLKVHMTKHSGIMSHVCSVCHKGFIAAYLLNRHMMKHTGKWRHLCSVCGKGFSNMAHLKSHSLVHTREKPHVCPECGRGFSQSRSLQTHMTTHTGERAHVCHYCGVRCSAKGNLTKHIMIHTGEKPHKCPDCGKSFKMRNEMMRHMTVHTGEKAFVCSDCGKAFSVGEKLRLHRFSHTGEVPHMCSNCDKGFNTKSALNRHMLVHTGEKPHICSQCGKACSQAGNLRTHMKVHRAELKANLELESLNS